MTRNGDQCKRYRIEGGRSSNGQVALENGAPTGVRAGRVVRSEDG